MNAVRYIILILALVMPLIFIHSPAEATSTFYRPPETNVPDWAGPHPYMRNIYWDFSTNPVGTSDQFYYGTHDILPGDVVSCVPPAPCATHFVSGDNKYIGNNVKNTGYKLNFHISDQALSTDPQFLYIEFDSLINNDDSSSIILLLRHPGFRIADSAGSDGQTSSTMTWKNGTPWQQRWAWYKFSEFPTEFELEFTFHTAYSVPDTHAYMDNLHIGLSATPEPVSALLFVFGAAPLGVAFLRKRK